MAFQVGDKVVANDNHGYSIDDGVIVSIDPKGGVWPYNVDSENGKKSWCYGESELTPR